MKRFTVIVLLGLGLVPMFGTASVYENPVRALDLPDPSVIRTSDGYWATATSSEWAPHFPIYFSKDLVNWEQKGSVFNEAPAWAKGSFWAPEIAEYRGTYFVYYTARRHDGRLAVAVATAPHPQGPYTDHGELVAQELGSIDAMAFTDDEGRRWLMWKEDGNSQKKPTPIFLQLLSDDGLKLVGERREIMTNDCLWEGPVVEGSFVLKRGEYYYMFFSGASCCGRNCNYALGVARARQMEGPWEKYAENPILAENEAWRCPGHGSIVTDSADRYWLLYHAYEREGFVATGRQMLLNEVTFGPDGWPSINGGKGPSRQAAAPAGAAAQQDSHSFADEFDAGSTLRPGWQWPIGRKPAERVANGSLLLSTGAGPAVVAQSLRSASFTAEVLVEIPAAGAAGVAVFGNEANSLALQVDAKKVSLRLRQKAQESEIASVALPAGKSVRLRITSDDGARFRFAASGKSGEWQEISTPTEGGFLPQWDRALRVGLLVSGPDGAVGIFDRFSLAAGAQPSPAHKH